MVPKLRREDGCGGGRMICEYQIRSVPYFKPCPVCGKRPKVKYYGVNSGRAYCKPIFGRTHKEVVVNCEQPSKLKWAIAMKWNAEVKP